MKLVIAIIIVAASLAAAEPSSGQQTQDGRPSFSETSGGGFDVPEFDLPDLYGLRHSPSRYRGKVILLYFMGHD